MVALLILVIIYLSFIGLGLPDALVGSAWPVMYTMLRVPVHYAGLVSMIVSGATVFSSLMCVRLVRRFGTGMVTFLSVLLTAIALGGIALSGNFTVLCLWAIPLGLGAGSVDSALNNYVALHYRARHMSWLHCFWGLGASAGPVVMSLSLAAGGRWNHGFGTVSLIQFALAALILFSLPLWHMIKNGAHKIDSDLHENAAFTRLLALPGLKAVLAVFFLYCSIEMITGFWGASYLVRVHNISADRAAGWVALYYFGITAGRFVSGFVTMKLNNRQMIRLGQLIIALGTAFLLFPCEWALAGGFFLIGLGCAPVFPSLIHETPQSFGANNSQAVIGIQMASAYVGTTLMPPLFGRIAAFSGFAVFPAAIAVLLVIKFLLCETANRNIAAAKAAASGE